MFKLRARIAKLMIALLVATLPNLIFAIEAKAVVADCTSSNFTIEAKSNSVFYFDNGTSITSNYVQYLVTNKTGSSISGYYAKLENFSNGNKIAIATYEDAARPFLTTLANNEGINLYWYLSASGTDNSSTTFDITIYNGVPAAGTAVCKLTKTITKVDSTIAANANKLTSVIYSTLPTADPNGSATFTATVKGQTGTIGAGPTSTNDVNLSPATTSNFDAKRYRLSGTSYRCGSGAETLNVLYIPNACSGQYTAVFTYQYLSSSASNGSASNTLSPIMQIASGSQMKHTSTPSFTIATIGTAPSNQVTTNAATDIYSTSAKLTGVNDYGTYTSIYFCYSSTNPGANFSNNCASRITAVSDGAGGYYADLSGLTAETTYYFEFTGETSGPTYTKGGVLSFLAHAYSTTNSASSVSFTTATFNGSQTGIASSDVDTSNSYFYYSTTDPGANNHINQSTASRISVSSSSPFSTFTANVTGLSMATTYYYEIVVKDINSITYVGGVQSFTTLVRYTVTFSGNSQTTGTPSSATITQASQGASITLATKNTLAKTGYTFGGWNENNGGTGTNRNENTSYTPTQDLTLYATWNGNKYIYDGNTGSGSAPSDQTFSGTTLVAASNTFTAPGSNSFDGWCTTQPSVGSSCSGTRYASSANLPTPTSATVTLYAIWVSAGTVSLNYEGSSHDSGSVPSSQSGSTGSAVTVSSTSITKSGYTFGGWCSSSLSAGTSCSVTTYAVSSTFTLQGTSSTIYAIWTANKYSYDGNTGTGSGPSDQTYAGSTLTGASNTFTAPSGYTFGGWCTTQPSVGGTCGGTGYAAGDNLPTPGSATVTLYAIWTATSSGGGGSPAPAPVYVPNPPTIISISAPEVCALNSQITIKGTYLSGATVTVDGVAARVISSTSNELVIALPNASIGTKSIKVTNADGSATTTIKYVFEDTPEYVNVTYPEMFKDVAFKYTFSATGAKSYSIIGKLPAGLSLNPLTGEISGTPTVDGDFSFTIVANNICDNAFLNVSMFIDRAIPDAYTCTVAFNVPSVDTISANKLAQLRNCLDKIVKVGPTTIDPVIFLSGGVPQGLTTDELMNHPRYLQICELLNEMGIIAQIVVGAFDGAKDQVQIMVYWPVPFDV